MITILSLQASMFPRAAGGWGRWAAGVVFEDWECLRDRVSSGVPGGRRIVAAVDAIAQTCPPGPLSSQDLVHGNFNLANGPWSRPSPWPRHDHGPWARWALD